MVIDGGAFYVFVYVGIGGAMVSADRAERIVPMPRLPWNGIWNFQFIIATTEEELVAPNYCTVHVDSTLVSLFLVRIAHIDEHASSNTVGCSSACSLVIKTTIVIRTLVDQNNKKPPFVKRCR